MHCTAGALAVAVVVFRMTPPPPQIPIPRLHEFVIPSAASSPDEIVRGPDGALWFTEFQAHEIGRITLSGAVTEFPLAKEPNGIALGPDDALWFTEDEAIGRLSPSGTVTEFPLPSDALCEGIALGPDGALWFTESFPAEIGRITPSGAVTEFPLPKAGADAEPEGIAAGPDGALWFTENEGNKIGRITPSGTLREFRLPAGQQVAGEPPAGKGPTHIALGPDGALWFSENFVNAIGRITVHGAVREFQLSRPTDIGGIAWGPGGALWFTENDVNRIGRMTPGGVVTADYVLPGAYKRIFIPPHGQVDTPEVVNGGPAPVGIALGPDGALWFTESDANKIGRFQP